MTYLFIGMMIGVIIGTTIGSLAVAFKSAEKEIARLEREVDNMHNKKYGIWKTRYAENSRNIFEDWVRRDGDPILFSTERGALEYMHGMEMKTQGAFTEFEVREVS